MARKFWRITDLNRNAPTRRLRRQWRATKFLLISAQKFNVPSRTSEAYIKSKKANKN